MQQNAFWQKSKKIIRDFQFVYREMLLCCRTTHETLQEKYHWEYLFTQKDTRQKKVNEGFEWNKSDEEAMYQSGVGKEKSGRNDICRKRMENRK